ncbi:T9SS type A sorting domain-containing protein [Pontibacter arcticus]|uniref:Por secretion system C-terminal sorting domain-containing protein n=1 Tax=Pontibacter arcticus TaxID=2080288 RepID=A0A364RJA8_9BACT|nr:T9SS type A sorting domain-containing protein [Pontibacter arcticus]RAU84363.1 hypothetical protein DP923_04810 [Pontibacter arcticus]
MVINSTVFSKITSPGFRMLLLLFTMLLAHRVQASEPTQMIPLTLEKRVQEADLVLEGEVVSQKSFWDANHANIYTSNIIRVYKLFKGETKAQEVEVITEGGTVGMSKHVFSTALHLSKGQQGVFFLRKDLPVHSTPENGKLLSVRAYGSQQGLVTYNLERGTAKDVFSKYKSVDEVYQQISKKTGKQFRTVSRNERLLKTNKVQQQKTQGAAAPVITDFSPKVASAGTKTILTITGSGFGNSRGENGAVEFKNADDGGDSFIRPLAAEYISWSNTQIKMYVPSTSEGENGSPAGTGQINVISADGNITTSTAVLTIPFAYSNISYEGLSYQPVLADRNNQGGYTVRFSTSMANRTEAREGFTRALNSWVCNTTVNWQIGQNTTIDASAEDNQNVIRFAPRTTLGENVLARTVSRYAGCQTNSTPRQVGWRVQEFDMEISSNINWEYGPGAPQARQFDFETVILHELGHAHQLGHVILPNSAVMHFAVEDEVLFRTLSPDDIAGGATVIANSLIAEKAALATGCRSGEAGGDAKPYRANPEGGCVPEVKNMTAAYQGSDVLVKWEIENGGNIDYFTVQRSAEGITWNNVSSVIDRTTSNSYAYTDPTPLPNSSFYRIKVTYNNGKVGYTIRKRAVEPSALRVLKPFPNPVNPQNNIVQLLYLVEQNTSLSLQLYSITGKLMGTYTIVVTADSTPAQIDMTEFAAGIYILKWQDKSTSGETRIVKL